MTEPMVCPLCGARVNEWCVDRSGRRRRHHWARNAYCFVRRALRRVSSAIPSESSKALSEATQK